MMQEKKQVLTQAFRAAFPQTLPIMAGFLFLGVAYGIYMNALGLPKVYPVVMSMVVFAGSVEFLAGDLLLGSFSPFAALGLTIAVNARHLFYGISMLEKYHAAGRKKFYLIFGLCDESFSINCMSKIPQGVDAGWFYLFVTLLNQVYWVFGAALGGMFGAVLKLDTTGIEFVMTALFVVIFLEQWLKERTHICSVLGLVISVLSLLLFGGNRFVLPAMMFLFGALTLLRGKLEKEER